MNNKKPLKILLITSASSSQLEPKSLSSVMDQAHELIKDGHKVTLISMHGLSLTARMQYKRKGIRDDQSLIHGVNEIISYYTKSNIETLDEYFQYRKGKQIIENLIEQKWMPDIIHVHSFKAGKLALWLHNNYYVPLVTSEYSENNIRSLTNTKEKRKASQLYRFSSVNLTSDSHLVETLKRETGVPFSIFQTQSMNEIDTQINEDSERNISDINKIHKLEEIYYSIIRSPEIIQASSTISQQGGICKVAYQMGFLLSQRQHRMTTFTSEFDEETIDDSLGRVILLRQPRWIQKLPAYLSSYFKTLYFTRDVHSIFKEKNRNPNCVTISHRDTFGADIAIGHSCHMESLKIKKSKKNPLWILNPIHHLYLKQEQAICNNPGTRLIAISKAIAEEYKKNYGIMNSFVDVIPNGVDLVQFNPSNKKGDRNSILKELQLSQDSFLILFVGNEFKRKGLEFIIDALPLINDNNLHLLVLGHAEKTAFQKRADQHGLSHNVHFLGRRSDAARFFSGSDIFVIPADYEPFGLVGIESMSCGTPILATKLGGFLDYLKDGVNGYFIERDCKDIAEKIRLIKGRDLTEIEEMSHSSRATAEQFSWPNIGHSYSQVIRKTAAQKSNTKI